MCQKMLMTPRPGEQGLSSTCFIMSFDKAREGCHPKDVWNYRDETCAYAWQQLWFRRGGLPSGPGIESEKLLTRL